LGLVVGIINAGFEARRLAWPKLDHVLSVRQSGEEGKGEGSPELARTSLGPHCLPNKLLNDFSVDLLLTGKQGFANNPSLSFERDPWEQLIS
jgi:hypothetical protein